MKNYLANKQKKNILKFSKNQKQFESIIIVTYISKLSVKFVHSTIFCLLDVCIQDIDDCDVMIETARRDITRISFSR